MKDWLTQNWGNVASLAGLGVSIVVLIFSKRAATAAREAKIAIERSSAAKDLRECGDKISFIRVFCDNGNWEVGSFVCNGLLQDVSFLSNRWALHFGNETKENLNALTTQLDTLHSQLRKFITRPPKPAEVESLTAAVARIGTLISAEVGRYESLIEQ
jgi:hypothetical protein